MILRHKPRAAEHVHVVHVVISFFFQHSEKTFLPKIMLHPIHGTCSHFMYLKVVEKAKTFDGQLQPRQSMRTTEMFSFDGYTCVYVYAWKLINHVSTVPFHFRSILFDVVLGRTVTGQKCFLRFV